MTKEQELNLDKNRKKFDIREEYFVSCSAFIGHDCLNIDYLYSG